VRSHATVWQGFRRLEALAFLDLDASAEQITQLLPMKTYTALRRRDTVTSLSSLGIEEEKIPSVFLQGYINGGLFGN
jgi:hypothetical protein